MHADTKTLQMDNVDVKVWYHDKFRGNVQKINAVFGVRI